MKNYDEVLSELASVDTKHLLLGNGFSISCDPIFKYQNLFEYACESGLSEEAKSVFEILGTGNFEGVLSQLQLSAIIASCYNDKYLAAKLKADFESVKKSLVSSIAKTHLPNSGLISDAKKNSCALFLAPFHNVFTTSYDLLLYWVSLNREDKKIGDCFREDPDNPNAPYVIFRRSEAGNPGIYFIHGALHLYRAGSEIRKQCWVRSGVPLIESITKGIEDGEFPLFVAEGNSDKKMEQITKNSYLFTCFSKLAAISSPLVVFGLSLGSSDTHIAEAISKNLKLKKLYFGIFGDVNSSENAQTLDQLERIKVDRKKYGRSKRNSELEVILFDSSTVNVWDRRSTLNEFLNQPEW